MRKTGEGVVVVAVVLLLALLALRHSAPRPVILPNQPGPVIVPAPQPWCPPWWWLRPWRWW